MERPQGIPAGNSEDLDTAGSHDSPIKKARPSWRKPGLEIKKLVGCNKWSRCEKSEDRACFCTSHKMTLANA